MLDADYYELLEVERTADEGTIKSSYRRLAMRYHPDKNPGCKDSEGRFKAISQAYDCLRTRRSARPMTSTATPPFSRAAAVRVAAGTSAAFPTSSRRFSVAA